MTSSESVYIVNNPHDRIRRKSPKSFNQLIDQKANMILKSTIAIGPIAIRDRIEDLDSEWDVDRWMMVLFSSAVMIQLWQSIRRDNRKWLYLPLVQSSFFMMHTLIGWSPPALILRKLGVRSRHEIEAEKEALLKVLFERDWEEKQKDELIEDWSNDVF